MKEKIGSGKIKYSLFLKWVLSISKCPKRKTADIGSSNGK